MLTFQFVVNGVTRDLKLRDILQSWFSFFFSRRDCSVNASFKVNTVIMHWRKYRDHLSAEKSISKLNNIIRESFLSVQVNWSREFNGVAVFYLAYHRTFLIYHWAISRGNIKVRSQLSGIKRVHFRFRFRDDRFGLDPDGIPARNGVCREKAKPAESYIPRAVAPRTTGRRAPRKLRRKLRVAKCTVGK